MDSLFFLFFIGMDSFPIAMMALSALSTKAKHHAASRILPIPGLATTLSLASLAMTCVF